MRYSVNSDFYSTKVKCEKNKYVIPIKRFCKGPDQLKKFNNNSKGTRQKKKKKKCGKFHIWGGGVRTRAFSTFQKKKKSGV